MSKYEISKEYCSNMIGSAVCPSCGESVKPMETVNNSGNPTFWAGCEPCGQFSNGVPRRVYNIAKELVEDCGYIQYSFLREEPGDDQSTKEYKNREQVRGACGVVADVLSLALEETHE